jgi:hypothetical protein
MVFPWFAPSCNSCLCTPTSRAQFFFRFLYFTARRRSYVLKGPSYSASHSITVSAHTRTLRTSTRRAWSLGRMPKYNPEKDIPDLSGKVILITGGTVFHTSASTSTSQKISSISSETCQDFKLLRIITAIYTLPHNVTR